MWVLIEVGQQIGALKTIGLVLLTAVIGVALLRQQGFSTLMRARQKMESGQLPAQEMGEGIFLAIGGALLLTPGFITDFVGFCCLLPGIRQVLIGFLLRRMRFTSMGGGSGWNKPDGQSPFGSSPLDSESPHQDSNTDGKRPTTLEAEYRRED